MLVLIQIEKGHEWCPFQKINFQSHTLEALCHFRPIDHIPKSGDIIGSSVLVF